MQTSNLFGAPVAPAPAAAPAAAALVQPAAPVQPAAAPAPAAPAPQTTKYVSSFTKENLLGVRVEGEKLYAVLKGGGELYLRAKLAALTADPDWRASLVRKEGKEGSDYLAYCPGSYYIAI